MNTIPKSTHEMTTPAEKTRPASRLAPFTSLLRAGLILISLLAANAAQAYTPNLATVPWLGNPALPHQVYSGGPLILQGVATDLDTGNALIVCSATWDSGAGPTYNAGTNGYALEATHTYTGAINQPFTATLTVTLCDTTVLTDTMRVVVRADNQEVRVNMAIDKGLWFLHKSQRRTSSDSGPSSYWVGFSSYYISATSSAVQAFAINNHRESGDPTEDPYVDSAKRGMRYLLSNQHGTLVSRNIGIASIYDENGNGIGLEVNQNTHGVYQTGQLIDAIVASGTPGETAVVGNANVLGETYEDIVQDLLDGYSWAQNPSSGGWLYQFPHRTINVIDTSSSHWWAIGVLAAETWGLDAPQFVKDKNWQIGIPRVQLNSQPNNCRAGYRSTSCAWDSCRNTTSAALIMMNADDIPRTNPRFTCAENWINGQLNNIKGNYYAMFQTAKALRTAVDANGDTDPVELLAGTRDWYSEFADYLITTQLGTGAFRSSVGTAGYYMSYSANDMSTAWGLIMLSPSLFELPPQAVCNASPLIDGTADIGGSVNFDGSQSAHPDSERTIVSYSWNFTDGSPLETGETTSHSFTDVGIYDVVLTVEDDNGNTDTDVCQIDVRDNDIPPASRPGGPYQICLGDDLALDGSSSSDLDNQIVLYEWDISSPISFSPVDSYAISWTVPGATFTSVGIYDIGLRVTDNDGSNGGEDHTTSSFTTVNVIPADDPSCNQPPVAFDGGPYIVDEGSTVPLNGSGSDPDGDPLAFAWDLDNDSIFETAGAAPSFDAGSLDDSVVTIWLRVTDPSGLFDDDGTTVTVNNVAPDVEAGADQTINENDSITLAASFTDPGTLDTHVVSVDWGDGTNGSSLTDSHQYLDDGPTGTPSDTYTVTVTVTDDDGGVGSDTLTVTVNNVDPVVEAGGDQTIDENESITLAASFTDVGTLDTHVVSVDWGDGSPNGSSLTASHQYLDDNPTGTPSDTYTVTVTVTDDDTGVGSDTLTVTVNNVDPVVEAGGDQTIDENDSITLAASFTDVGTLDTHVVSVDWGDGSPNGTSLTESHQYLDDNPTGTPSDTYTVTVTVTDDDTGVGSDTLTVTVNNLAPVITEIIVPVDPQPLGFIDVEAPFTDVGTNDTHTCTIDWDDGLGAIAGTVDEVDGSGTCSGSSDLPAGVYSVLVTVTDDDGDSDTLTATTLIVVYDPSAGFVTGGGWFNSLPGADKDNPEAVGKANFGFVAKYKKGAQVPDGQTEFQFKAGDLNFHSTDYQWLVVTGGCMAQYKGTGTINGDSGYDFMLTLRDGSLCGSPTDDAFRIKITGVGGLRYDNTGGDDNIGPQSGNVQPINGGSIKIHRKK